MTSNVSLEKCGNVLFFCFFFAKIRELESQFVIDPTETGGVWEPDAAASHAGAGPKDSSLRAPAQRLPEEATWRGSRPQRCRK